MKTVQVGGHCITLKPLESIRENALRKVAYRTLIRALPGTVNEVFAEDGVEPFNYSYIAAMGAEASFTLPMGDMSADSLLAGFEVWLNLNSPRFSDAVMAAINDLNRTDGDEVTLPPNEVSEDTKNG